ncbi:MAG: D-alanyl-D-alanine carboxypeptidase/D-alanyl-D-alanine-endopeptidase [Phycisphaerales bacterium]
MLLAVVAVTAATAQQAYRDIEALVGNAALGSSSVAYHIVDLDTGAILAEGDAERMMLPASNLKLITTGAALLVLGPDASFETTMRWDGSRLTIVGTGDPALADPELLEEMGVSIESLFDLWIEDLRAEGIDSIDTLVVDDRIFDEARFHPNWPADQLNAAYCAEVAGFNVHGNIVAFYAHPASTIGHSPNYTIEPDVRRWVSVENRARTIGPKGGQNSLWISRPPTANEFSLFGSVRIPQKALVTVHDPAELFARWFSDRLKRRNIKVGEARSAHVDDPVAPGAVVGRPIRTPMSTLVLRCNRDSENLYAEALLKRLGREVTGQPGGWRNGGAVIRTLLSKHLGPGLATQTQISDGSGLSRENRVSPRVMTAWLAFMNDRPDLASVYLDSLAVGGESGTLRRRFGDIEIEGEVLGKSGYINGVSCLSGYVRATNGRMAAFSVLVNDIPSSVPIREAKKLQEQIVKRIERHLIESPGVLLTESSDEAGDRLGG